MSSINEPSARLVYQATPAILKAIKNNTGPAAKYLREIADQQGDLAVAEALIAWARDGKLEPPVTQRRNWEQQAISRRASFKNIGTGLIFAASVSGIGLGCHENDQLGQERVKRFYDGASRAEMDGFTKKEQANHGHIVTHTILGGLAIIKVLLDLADQNDGKYGTKAEIPPAELQQGIEREIKKLMDDLDLLIASHVKKDVPPSR